jgi:serine phosphatase RsbU (regulator of sigma subunit)
MKVSEEMVREQNEALFTANEKMNKSIKAAEVIQQAILPYEQKAKLLLKDYFVLLRPRDVVSGDFFWLNRINGITVLAAVDCTGHGVPGAFMSLIANTLLDKIVRVWQVTDPAEILAMLNEEVAVVLRQRETGNSEGMDVCLCAWESNGSTTQLSFAGAKRPLYFMRANGTRLESILPDRQSIGGMIQTEKNFTSHLITLEQGSTIYLSSDGFVDQNNPARIRYGSVKFETLLGDIHPLPMSVQHDTIIRSLDDFRQGSDQRDDILVIGVRL